MRKFNGSSNFGGKSGGRSSRGSFKKFDKEGSRGSFKHTKRFDRDSSESDSGFKLHQAVCDKCGRSCDVPFKPTGGKPIYCRSCFRANNSGSLSGTKDTVNRFEREFKEDRREAFEDGNDSNPTSEELAQINRKLDKIMKFLKIN